MQYHDTTWNSLYDDENFEKILKDFKKKFPNFDLNDGNNLDAIEFVFVKAYDMGYEDRMDFEEE